MSCGFIIPVYRHGSTLGPVIRQLLPLGLPVIVVDDGNNEKDRAYIQAAGQLSPLVHTVTRAKNGGKGRAFSDGARKAQELGLTHIFQVDADGQHDTGACAAFLAASQEQPDAIICGCPCFDESAPAARRKGREFSNAWARIVSWNTDIRDVLCGFRIYPLAPYLHLLDRHVYISPRMGFDTDVLVRLLWQGLPLINKEVRVSYPADGISNFRMVRDNIGISLTYTRLCAGMLLRLPLLLTRLLARLFRQRRHSRAEAADSREDSQAGTAGLNPGGTDSGAAGQEAGA